MNAFSRLARGGARGGSRCGRPASSACSSRSIEKPSIGARRLERAHAARPRARASAAAPSRGRRRPRWALEIWRPSPKNAELTSCSTLAKTAMSRLHEAATSAAAHVRVVERLGEPQVGVRRGRQRADAGDGGLGLDVGEQQAQLARALDHALQLLQASRAWRGTGGRTARRPSCGRTGSGRRARGARSRDAARGRSAAARRRSCPASACRRRRRRTARRRARAARPRRPRRRPSSSRRAWRAASRGAPSSRLRLVVDEEDAALHPAAGASSGSSGRRIVNVVPTPSSLSQSACRRSARPSRGRWRGPGRCRGRPPSS